VFAGFTAIQAGGGKARGHKKEVTEVAYRVFHIVPEDPEKPHIPNQVNQPPCRNIEVSRECHAGVPPRMQSA
jgi:hypothetical protein